MHTVDREAAGRVGQEAELLSLAASHLRWMNHASPTSEVDLRFQAHRLSWGRSVDGFAAVFMFRVAGIMPVEPYEDTELLFDGEVHIRSQFACPEHLRDEDILSFIRTSGFAASVPFFRQSLQSMMSQSGWPAVALPLVTHFPKDIDIVRSDRDSPPEQVDESEHIEVYEANEGEPRAQHPFASLPADPVPMVGDILLLPLSRVDAEQEGKLPMDSAAYRVVDITRLYLDAPLRHQKVWVHVRRMMEADYDRTPV